jgi:hypothetical protein
MVQTRTIRPTPAINMAAAAMDTADTAAIDTVASEAP